MNRRTFLKSAAAASAAALLRPSFAEAALPQAKITRIRFYEAVMSENWSCPTMRRPGSSH